jgi:DNA-binding transcriptional LysR family regulator
VNKIIPTEFLRSFVTIAELDSFTQAGDKLARSQSAISLQIKKLEEILGQQVFSRKGNNFELTPSGEILMRYAAQILQLNDRALGELNSKTIVGKVRLGITSEFATSLLPKIVGRFSRQYPQITLEVICDLSCNLNNDLKQKKYDLILSVFDDEDQVERERSYIKRDKLVWVSASKHCTNYDPIPLVVAPEGCIYRKRGLECLKRANIPWRIIYTIMDLSGIKAVIEEGLGMTVLAESAVPSSLKIVPSPNDAKGLGDIGIVLVSADKNMTEATSILADYIKLGLQP